MVFRVLTEWYSHHHGQFYIASSLPPKKTSYPLAVTVRPQPPTNLLSFFLDLPVLGRSYKWDHTIMLPLVDWFLWPSNVVISKIVHAAACVGTSFLFVAEKYPYYVLFIQLLIDGHWGGFLFLDIMNNTAVNIDVRVFVRAYVSISLGYKPGVELLCPVTLCFNILRSCQSLFQSEYTILCSHQCFWHFLTCIHFYQIYYLFYGSEFWILERPFYPKTIREFFCISF